MEYILLNCVLALLDYPGATLLGINRLLVDKEYRSRVIAKIRNPIVKTFWLAEFTSWSEKYATEAIAPVQNKVGQFLSASIIRNIVAQVKSTINPRQIMDEGKIFIVNLSKGKIGEDNMRLLGGMIVTKIQLAAMERVDIKYEKDRKDFYLFVDEFQNFANESFAAILSEARKYRLNLTVAHQYIEQLEEPVRDGVFGNVGTMLMFRVGAQDAQFLETEFTPTFLPEDLTNLAKYQMYLKLMVDGVATQPFSANSLPPIAQSTGSEEKVIAVSRERHASPRAVIEEKVLRWSGMETGSPFPVMPGTTPVNIPGMQYPVIQTEAERDVQDALGGTPAHLRAGTPEYARAGMSALDGDEVVEDTGEYLRLSPERLAAISKPGAAKKDKPKFKHTCTRCGKTWDMPIQLDPSRPMYCAECMPIMREERKGKQKVIKQAVHDDGSSMAGFVSGSPTPAAQASRGGVALQNAMQAVEEGIPVQIPKRRPPDSQHAPVADRPLKREPPAANRPRLVVTDPGQLERLSDDAEDDDYSALLDDVAQSRGRRVETRKEAAMPPTSPSPPARPVSTFPSREAGRDGGSNARHRSPDAGAGHHPPKDNRSANTQQRSGNRPHVRRSLEDVYRDAEERGDRQITRKPVAPPSAAPGTGDQPSVVFRRPSSNASPSHGSGSGPKPIAPGQRVRFDSE